MWFICCMLWPIQLDLLQPILTQQIWGLSCHYLSCKVVLYVGIFYFCSYLFKYRYHVRSVCSQSGCAGLHCKICHSLFHLLECTFIQRCHSSPSIKFSSHPGLHLKSLSLCMHFHICHSAVWIENILALESCCCSCSAFSTKCAPIYCISTHLFR